MASLKSFSAEPEPQPERFHRTQRRNTISERAASPSEASSVDDDEPGGVRLDLLSVTGSPEEKYTPPHARHGVRASRYMQSRRNATESPSRLTNPSNGDDVFVSPAKPLGECRGDRAVTVANMQRLDNALAPAGDDALAVELRPKTSNLSSRHQINGIDAQAVLPPTACVFVANLPEPKDDLALEVGLTREFIQYGKCYIKIRRDGRHMPFAFVQYTTEEEARNALEKGKGAIICGRSCRTEMVKANRTFIIMRKYGHAITIPEARAVVAAFGEIARAEMLHPKLRDPLGYPPTVLVEFAMFDPSRDLHTAFRNDDQYSVAAFDLKKNCAATRQNSDEQYLANCERDRRSIFLGDLPASTEEESLGAMFSEAGEILKINIVNRPNNTPGGGGFASGVRTLAFVEYAQPDMPEIAIAKFNGAVYNGTVIKVERKVVKDRGPTPRNSRMLQAARRPDENAFSPTHAAQGSANRSQGGFRQQHAIAYAPQPQQQLPLQQPPSSHQQQAITHAPQPQQQLQLQQQQQTQPGPAAVQTPNRTVPNRDFTQQTPQAPVGLASMPPPPPAPTMYAANPTVYGGYPTLGAPSYNPMAATGNYTFNPSGGGANTAMSPHANANLSSPWSYYTGYWPSMSTGYDPAPLYNPYMFPANPAGPTALQSPTPMLDAGGSAPSAGFLRTHGGAAATAPAPAVASSSAPDEAPAAGGDETPTRVKSASETADAVPPPPPDTDKETHEG